MKDHMSLMEFTERFPDEASCQAFIIQQRWGGKPRCAKCDHDKVYRLSGGKLFKCAKCKQRFSVRTGTVMEESGLPLRKWLLAIHIMTTARKGISSVQFAKDVGVSQKTAWFLAQRIRKACAVEDDLPLAGDVEADEAYFGGQERFKHADKKLRAGRGAVGKVAVFGMRERGGRLKAMPIPETCGSVLKPIIHRSVERDSTVHTDESTVYNGLQGRYRHERVNHSKGIYVKGDASTNAIESVWAVMKRSYKGIHHWWSPKHLHRYIAEHVYRLNMTELPGEAAIGKMIRDFQGKRLTYARLTA